MIPWYYLFLAYCYGLACAACHFLLSKYSSVFLLRDWFYIMVLGWLIEPVYFIVWWFKRVSKLIDDIW